MINKPNTDRIISTTTEPPVRIYTDGACRNNPGPGGWGALLIYGDRERELSGGEAKTTNNRMEMTAAIRALEALKRRVRVELYSDSSYLVRGMTEWLTAWQARGWKTAGKKPVENLDLWQQLDQLSKKHQVAWRWIKGHAGEPGNERAHKLAEQAIPA